MKRTGAPDLGAPLSSFRNVSLETGGYWEMRGKAPEDRKGKPPAPHHKLTMTNQKGERNMKQTASATLPANRGFLALVCALEAVYGVISMFAAVLLNHLATSVGSIGTVGELLRAGLPVVLFALVYGGGRALAEGMTQCYADRAAQKLRRALDRSVLGMDSAQFARRDTGEYLNLMTGDVLLVRDQYYAKLPLIFCYVAQFLFCVGYSLLLNPVVGLVLMALSVAQYFTPSLFNGAIGRRTVEQSRQTAAFTSKLKELLLGFPVVKSYGGEAQAQGEFDRADGEMTRARVRTAVLTQVMLCVNMGVGWAMVVTPVVLSGYFVMTGAMAAGSILTVFYIANRYSMPAMDLASAWSSIRSSRGMREKLAGFLAHHPPAEPEENRPIRQGLEVRDLSFSYHGDAPALRQVSFRFEMGKKYLLLGESGCGKSTLLRALSGQYPAHGVYVDGAAMEDLPAGTLAGRLVLVGQQPYVFRRTLADNIDFLHTGDRARLAEAVDKCCLGEFVDELPHGLDTVVDEEQRQLSGGQKARIGLARAVYTGPDVLLLDEVTSALDPAAARRIEEMVLDLEGTLVIHVSHKPAADLLGRYDGVLTMEDGRIVRACPGAEGAARPEGTA